MKVHSIDPELAARHAVCMQESGFFVPNRIWRVVCFVLVTAALTGGGLAQSQNPCAAADALLDAGLIDGAKTTYTKLLTEDLKDKPPQLNCARQGLARTRDALAKRSFNLGKLYGKAGDHAGALTEFKKALEANHESQEVIAEVKGLLSPEQKNSRLLARVRALAAWGLHQEALNAIKTGKLSEDKQYSTSAALIPEDLEYLAGGKIALNIRRNLEPWGWPLLEVASALLLLGVLVQLLRYPFRKRTLKIGDFDTNDLADARSGKDFAAILGSQLERMASGSASDRMQLVTGQIQNISVPADVQAVVPSVPGSFLSPQSWVKALPALLNWLFPSRTIKVAGTMHKPGKRGAGVTIELSQGNKILAGYTFWRSQFDDGSDPQEEDAAENLYQLAEYTAVWLLFELAARFESGLTLLGTQDWRGYAYFRAGCHAERQGRSEAAKKLYLRALRRDAKLRGARVNLAMLFSRAGDKQAALEQLKRAKREAVEAPDGDKDPTIYSAIHSIAALSYDLSQIAPVNAQASEASRLLRQAEAETKELLDRIDETLDKIKAGDRGYKDKNLEHHLKTIQPVASVMLGGLMIELDEPKGLALVQEEAEISNVSPSLQYNLGCSFSVVAKHAQDAVKKEKCLKDSLSHLNQALLLDRDLAKQVPEDRSLDCVRSNKPAEFNEILQKYAVPAATPVAEPSPPVLLAKLAIIGEGHARVLSADGVRTQDDLLSAASSTSQREQLASRLNVGVETLRRWANAMDILRIVGLGPTQANLLALAGIHSLGELGNSNASSLTTLLGDLSKASNVSEAPEFGTVAMWIEDAQKTVPKVQ